MFDLGRKKVQIVTGAATLSAGAILASLQDLEEYWDTVFEDMPPILRANIAAHPSLQQMLQTNLQAATDYAATVRRLVSEGKLKEATQTLVHFHQATVSFHQSAQRWDAVELGQWLLDEAVTEAFEGVEAVGRWLSELPDTLRNIGRGAANIGKWLIAGTVGVAVILAVKK